MPVRVNLLTAMRLLRPRFLTSNEPQIIRSSHVHFCTPTSDGHQLAHFLLKPSERKEPLAIGQSMTGINERRSRANTQYLQYGNPTTREELQDLFVHRPLLIDSRRYSHTLASTRYVIWYSFLLRPGSVYACFNDDRY
jgi:hypothetical protein